MRAAIIVLMVLLVLPFAGAAIMKASIYPSYSTFKIASVSPIVHIGNRTVIETSAARQFPEVAEILGKAQSTPLPVSAAKENLTCPIVPKTGLRIPPLPYPAGGNDCNLIGKGAEIEAFLQSLEKIAAACNARRASAWKAVLAAKKDLDKQIDELEVPQSGGAEMGVIPAYCPSYGYYESPKHVEIVDEEGKYYTRWLERIEKDTIEYCRLIDELIKPLWDACDEINFYRTCEELSDANRQAYHKLLAAKMNAANINYDYTDFFYTNTLQKFGWGNFRKTFNESAIECKAQARMAVQMPLLNAQDVSERFQPKRNIFSRLFGWLFGNK